MLELTTINTTELTNKKLGTQLNTIKKAVDTGNNQQWKIADAIATIVDDELFVDDFETEGNLAKVLGMSRPNLNKMKKASHYHKEVEELNAFTLTKVMELLVIPKEEIVDFLDGYMITPSSTCREVREAVSAWKDDNIVADAEITDAEDEADAEDAVEPESKAIDEESTQCDAPSAYFTILELVEKLEEAELIKLKEYIEKRL
nr:MAG TPA: protein of unknown function DUF1016 [Caudoviricetes sp.]